MSATDIGMLIFISTLCACMLTALVMAVLEWFQQRKEGRLAPPTPGLFFDEAAHRAKLAAAEAELVAAQEITND